MRTRLPALAAIVLVAGCGHDRRPDAVTSRGSVAKVVLDWHRARAAGDGEAACRLLTEANQTAMVRAGRGLAALGSMRSPDNCLEAVTLMGFSPVAPEVLLDTHVDAVSISGDRAAATARTSAVIDGLMGQVSLVHITLRWADGRWLIDRRIECLSGDLLERVIGEIRESTQATRGACTS